jgi:6-pyruvoyltetrahydropterin/6-carboxytetrahydropterin synthase
LVEVFLESDSFDNGMMIYDFGLLKPLKNFFDYFDHSIMLWDRDDYKYKNDMKNHSERWIEMGVNPTAEAMALVFLYYINNYFATLLFGNHENSNIKVSSVRVHETATGYAEAFLDDLKKEGFKCSYNLSFSNALMNEEVKNNSSGDSIFIMNKKNHSTLQQVNWR